MIITSSFGIIISARNSVNAKFLPLKFSRAKAYAASVMTTSMIAVVAAVKEAAEEGVLPCFPQVSLIDWDKGEREDAFLHANVTFPDGRMMNKHLLRYQGRLFSLVIEKRDRPATHFLLRNDHDDEGELRGIIDMLAENGLFADFEPYYTIAMTELRPFWKGSITEAG